MRLPARVKNWIPAILWAGLISGLSTDTFSSEHTSIIIIPALHWLFPHAGTETLELMHGVVRKIAHVVEYLVLSIFLMRGLRGRERGWKLRWAICAVVIAAGYASLDEFHQSFLPNRTASAWDVLLDTTGAAAAQMFTWLRHVSRQRRIGAHTIPSMESHDEHAE